MQAQWDAFFAMLAAERGAARNTLLAYSRDLCAYRDALDAVGTSALHASGADLRRAIEAMSALGLKPASLRRRISAIRQFHGFLYREGHRGDDPSLLLAGPKMPQALPKTLTHADIDRLFAAAREGVRQATTPAERCAALRMRALVELLYATGLRVSELVALPAAALPAPGKPSRDHLVVRGKGGRERLVFLTPAALSALAAFREACPPKRGEAFLFPAQSREGHLPRQVFARDLKALAGRAGLRAASISPHVLRHAFATHLLQNGADLRIIQQLLGHADITTTQIYTHLLDSRVQAMVRDLHPLNDPPEADPA